MIMQITDAKPAKSAAEIDQAVAANLRRLRIERDITQKSLAEMIGTSPQQIYKYESGVIRLSAGVLLIIADAMAVELIEFFGARKAVPADVDRLRAECEIWLRKIKSEETLATMARMLKSVSG